MSGRSPHSAPDWRRRAAWVGVRLRRFVRSRTGQALAAALITVLALTLLRAFNPWVVTEFRDRTFDAYQRLLPRPYTAQPVRIVDIDEASIEAFGQWPWPRSRLAALNRRLGELGAGAVAYDIIFAEPDRTTPSRIAADLALSDGDDHERAIAVLKTLPDHDKLFAEAIGQTATVLGFAASRLSNELRPPVKAGLAFVGVEPSKVLRPFHGAIVSLPLLNQAAAGVGAINLSARDRSGVIRRVPMLLSDGKQVYPNLAIEALRVAQGQQSVVVRGTGASGEADTGHAALLDMRVGAFRLPLTNDGEAWVYFDRDRPERYLSVKDLFDPAKDSAVRERIEGSIVLVGTSASGLLDARATPLGETVPGVAILAQLLEQILAQDFVDRPDWADGFEIVLTVLLGLSIAGLVPLIGARFSLIAGVVVLIAAIAASWYAFVHFRLLIDPIYPSLATLATYIAVERVLHLAADRDKAFARQAFAQYLAPELLARLESSPDGMKLGGENRELTVMFMDVRGFTPLSEALSATELVDFINTLLAPLTDAIQAELGTIDKYIGDSIMAFWNAPVDVEDHATRACRAALAMRAALQSLNDADAFGFAARGMAEPNVRIGIGLNTGLACVGNMGSAKRFNYSAMGDVVNVAARIEAATKDFGVDILVSEQVALAARGIALLEAGEIKLKGTSRPTRLFAVLGTTAEAEARGFAALQRLHGELLQAIAAGDCAHAEVLLARCRAQCGDDYSGLYQHLAQRIGVLACGARG
ncbi:adenylate/guanylate cyclase domain-containing protein [Rhodopseudomonas pseudopalustris]|uniref:CHASE2 domain-containing protein n=1 Tax=Rhodopseudomonas pseudopalustris TaxID=1513892 RepID=UPI003F95992E